MALFTKTVRKAADKTFDTMEKIQREVIPKTHETLDNANGLFNRLTNTSASIFNVAKIGIGITGFKYISDIGTSWYQGAKLIGAASDAVGIASDARNDIKKLANNTIKTEDEIVNILTKASGDFTSSTNQCTKNMHKMGQDFAHMAESVSQSSNLSSESIAYLSQDFHQASRCFMVTCVSLATSALAASMIYLQNSSCDDDQESMLCVAPLKSMAAATIVTGFVALGMLIPSSVQPQINEHMKPNFLIPEEGIDQSIEWTEEQLASIKDKNFDVFNLINIKRKCKFCKWTKSELEWLLSQDEDTFLNVILSGIQSQIA